jgi:hypothetical protein
VPERSETGRRAVGGWLDAIAESGWSGASLQTAAAASGLPSDTVLREAGDRVDALSAFLADLGAEAAAGAALATGSVRDRLFDGMMRGADRLQSHRAAVLALADTRDPAIALLLGAKAPALVRRLAAAAGVDSGGPGGALRQLALGAILAQAFRTWRHDDSSDMAATMAELDRLLARAERAETEGLSPSLLGLPGLGRLFRRAPAPAPDPPAD